MARLRIIAAVCGLTLLSGCGFTAGIQGAGAQLGPAVGAIDADIYAIAVAKYQAAQMFKAQIDGMIVLPPLPPPAITPSPVPGIPSTFPSSPPVSPSQILRKQVARDLTRWPTWEQLAEQ